MPAVELDNLRRVATFADATKFEACVTSTPEKQKLNIQRRHVFDMCTKVILKRFCKKNQQKTEIDKLLVSQPVTEKEVIGGCPFCASTSRACERVLRSFHTRHVYECFVRVQATLQAHSSEREM